MKRIRVKVLETSQTEPYIQYIQNLFIINTYFDIYGTSYEFVMVDDPTPTAADNKSLGLPEA